MATPGCARLVLLYCRILLLYSKYYVDHDMLRCGVLRLAIQRDRPASNIEYRRYVRRVRTWSLSWCELIDYLYLAEPQPEYI